MRVIIATTQLPLVNGGAEFQAEGLAAALVAAGHEAEVINIPENGRAPDRVTDDWGTPEQLEASIRSGTPGATTRANLARSSDGHDDKCLFIVDKPVGKERG